MKFNNNEIWFERGKGERGGKMLRIHFTFPNTPKNTVTTYHYNLHIQRLSEVVLIFIC